MTRKNVPFSIRDANSKSFNISTKQIKPLPLYVTVEDAKEEKKIKSDLEKPKKHKKESTNQIKYFIGI